jgi:hypothetical protein
MLNLPGTVARWAAYWRRSIFGAASLAGAASFSSRDFYRLIDAFVCFIQRDLHIASQVGSIAVRCVRAASLLASEEHIKDVAKSVSTEWIAKTSACLIGVMAESIIARSFIGIAQNLLGFINLFKAFFRARVAKVGVGVVFSGKLLKRFSDFVLRRISLDTQHFVVVSFCTHAHLDQKNKYKN